MHWNSQFLKVFVINERYKKNELVHVPVFLLSDPVSSVSLPLRHRYRIRNIFCCNAFSHFSQRKSLITKHLIDLTSVQYLRKILKLYSFVTTYRVAQLSNIYFLG